MTSDADEGHLRRLAELINDRIAALGPKAARTATPAQLLAVVSLGLADELVQAEQKRRDIENATRDAVKKAIARIDQRLATDARPGDAKDAPATTESGGEPATDR